MAQSARQQLMAHMPLVEAHARTCKVCWRPIIADAEGNPGFLGDACHAGRALLQKWMDLELAVSKARRKGRY